MPIVKDPDNFILNLPPTPKSISRRTKISKKGKRTSRYTIEVKAEPIAVASTAYGLSAPLARAYLKGVSARILQAGKRHPVAEDTKARRQQWGSSPSTPSAQRRFKAPTKKLSKKQRKQNEVFRSQGRKLIQPQMKKGAHPDTPPDPNATGWFNHSGRLREGITLFAGKGAARFSKSRNEFVWTIAATANRLKEEHFGGTTNNFQWFLEKFHDRVKPAIATKGAAYQTALLEVQSGMVIKLAEDLELKRKELRNMKMKMIGNVIKVVLA